MDSSEKRRANFSRDETNYLVELVSEKIDVIEDKSTGGVPMEAKNRAWAELKEAFDRH